MGIKVAFVTGPEENLGIKYLSAALKKHDHQTALFIDPQLFNDEILSIKSLGKIFDSKEKVVRDVLSYGPDLIAFSVCTDFSKWAQDLALKIKEKADIPIIWGGIHPTSIPEEVIRQEAVDMICVGEGESPLLELAESFLEKTNRTDIKNIWFKRDGRIIKNSLRTLCDVNALPFPDHGLYSGRKNGYFNIGYHTIASRGCPYRCSYCCHSVIKGLYGAKDYYRVRNPESLIEELEIAKKQYAFKIVRFYDDIFPYEVRWLEEFSNLYGAKIQVPFICYLHPGLVTERRVSVLKEAGCSEIRLGIQTLNPDIRKNILHRSETGDSIENAILFIKKNKIKVVTENILGLPQEKDSDVAQMMHFYNTHRPTRNHFFWLRYYPGLEIEVHKETPSSEAGLSQKASVFTQGGDTYKAGNRQLIVALHMLPFFPKWVVRRIINHKMWRFFPTFIPLWFLNFISNISSRSDSDKIWRDRTVKRYLTSMMSRS